MKDASYWLTALFILGSMCCTVSANMLLKLGAMRPGFGGFWPFTIVNGYVVMGAVIFVLAFLLYIMVLRRMPLNVAQAIFSLQIVLVIVAANWFLSEPMNGLRWLGIFLISIGLLVVIASMGQEATSRVG
ncbi:MAG: EamA family transporter [Gammaproteobacteria bacterium]